MSNKVMDNANRENMEVVMLLESVISRNNDLKQKERGARCDLHKYLQS